MGTVMEGAVPESGGEKRKTKNRECSVLQEHKRPGDLIVEALPFPGEPDH